jgi:hypothetical protein
MKFNSFTRRQILKHRIPKSRTVAYANLVELALRELPVQHLRTKNLRNGEGVFHDEAEIQKRLINFRLAKRFKPRLVVESHPGLGIGSRLYRLASPSVSVKQISDFISAEEWRNAIVDIDPFGRPWETLERYKSSIRLSSVVMVTSGEIHSVVRNLKRTFYFPTERVGKDSPQWVVRELIPRVEDLTNMPCRFFYAFPTSVRLILSRRKLPLGLWKGCQQWLWWFSRYG